MGKYDSMRKLKRNQMLVEYHKAHPEASLSEIGQLFNISSQRVWELLKLEENKKGADVTTP